MLLDILKQAGSVSVEIPFFLADIDLEQVGLMVLGPPAHAGLDDLVLHDGGGGTEVHQIHVAACKICQIAGEVEQGDDVGVALDQHGQVEIAVRGGVSGDATAKGVDGQQAGQVAAQVLDDEIAGRGEHL